MNTNLRNYSQKRSFYWILTTLFCLATITSCMSPKEQAEADQKVAETAKKAQEESVKTKGIEALNANTDKFAALAPPVQEIEAPYVNGKVVFVYKRAGNKSEFLTSDRLALGELYATSVAEAKTIVQINCFNIPDGEYINEKTKEKIPAFSVRCDVDLIDNTIPAVIARKEFENKNLPEKTRLKPTDKEIIAPEPYKDIQTFVRNLPRK
jgi:hypothetical protein